MTYSGTVSLAAGQTRSGVNGSLALSPGPPPSITNTSLPAGTVGVGYEVDLYFAGPSTETSDYTFSATGLPPGLSFGSGDALVGATIGGTPQAAGIFSVTITMTTVGAVPPLMSQQKFTLEVQPTVGYWLATANGQVYGQGSAGSYGGFPVTTTTGPVVGIAGVPSAKGYWLVTNAGNVSKHGSDIGFYGDPPGLGKHISNIVAMAASSDGKGYYLVGSDGGIFTFGDARFDGSVPGIGKHVHNIVGMVVNGSGGYMLVGSDGGVFNFGQSHFYGSLPGQGIHVNNIRGILPSLEDTGYVQVGSDGGVFNFGTGVPFYGSLPGIGVKVNNSPAELQAALRRVEPTLSRGWPGPPRCRSWTRRSGWPRPRPTRAVAEQGRSTAAWYEAQAAQAVAGRDEALGAARAEFFGGREDARVIAASPGLLWRRAELVREAEERLPETAELWRGCYTQLPGERWPDEAVAQVATSTVDGHLAHRSALLRGRGGQSGRRRPAGRGAHSPTGLPARKSLGPQRGCCRQALRTGGLL